MMQRIGDGPAGLPAASGCFMISSMLNVLLEAGRYLRGSQRSRIQQLAALRELDDRLLADIGVTPEEVGRARAYRQAASRIIAGLKDGGAG